MKIVEVSWRGKKILTGRQGPSVQNDTGDENVRARTLDLTHSFIPLRLARTVSRGAVSLNVFGG